MQRGQLSCACAELVEGSIRVQQQASKFTSRPTLDASLSCFCVGSELLSILVARPVYIDEQQPWDACTAEVRV